MEPALTQAQNLEVNVLISLPVCRELGGAWQLPDPAHCSFCTLCVFFKWSHSCHSRRGVKTGSDSKGKEGQDGAWGGSWCPLGALRLSPALRAGLWTRGSALLAPSWDPGGLLHFLGFSCPCLRSFHAGIGSVKGFLGC